MPRYRVSGLPPTAGRGVSAFFPNLTRMAASGAQMYKGEVHGFPGTARIPISGLPFAPQPDRGDIALMGLSRSSDAPPAFWPNLYYATPERNYRPGLLIQMYDPTAPELTTMIPVPAVSLRQTYQLHSARLSMGLTGTGTDPQGGRQIRQPVSGLVRWRRRRKGNGLPNWRAGG